MTAAIAPRRDFAGSTYRITTASAEIDVDVVHRFLVQSYWASGVPREVVRRAVDGSLCFGVFKEDEQVGFARAVTDRATFAYLMDVFVLPEHRARGVGKWLIEVVLAHPDLQGLRKVLLATRDAHGFYETLGFSPLSVPSLYLEIADPDVYTRG